MRFVSITCVLLFAFAFVTSEARVSCDKIISPKRCNKRIDCQLGRTGCSRIPTAPPPPEDFCTGSRRRRCINADTTRSTSGWLRLINAYCYWNKDTKNCERATLCRDDPAYRAFGGDWGGSPGATWMAASMFFCIPDCVNNPLHQFIPMAADNVFADGIDASWTLWGVDPHDTEAFCSLMWGDTVRGKEGPTGSYFSVKNIGLALDSCDLPPQTLLTDWVMGFNDDFLARYNGNTICCHLCGTCQTEKFRCNMVDEDDERGAHPCGSDAWGYFTKYPTDTRCMTTDD